MSVTPLPRGTAVLLLLTIATVFAANHVSARLALDHGVDVATAVTVRSAVTALFVLALLKATGGPLRLPAGVSAARAATVGLVLTVQSFCLYSAVARVPVALALLAFNTFPLVLTLITWAAGGERPSRRALIVMPVALLGLAIALDVPGVARASDAVGEDAFAAGIGFAFAAALAFALALHLTNRWLGGVDGRLRTALTMSVVAVVTAAAALASGGFSPPADAAGFAGLALLTLFYGSAITALFVVLPRVGAVSNTAVLNFEPIASLLLAWLVLGQTIAPVQIGGALVVVGAIVALSTERR